MLTYGAGMPLVRLSIARLALRRAAAGLVLAGILFSRGRPSRGDDWPQFRGPTGQGLSAEKQAPLSWSETDNVAWSRPIPGLGWSSPVVADGRVWLTAGDEADSTLRILSWDCTTGALLINRPLFEPTDFKSGDLGRINAKNSHASPTPVIAADRIIAHFGSHGTACLARDGRVLWRKRLKYDQQHGPGSSPMVWNNLVVIPCDGVDQQFVVALEVETGRERWRATRDGDQAYSTPLLIDTPVGQQIVSSCGKGVFAYEPDTGREVWRFRYEGHSVVPRPVFAADRLFVASGYWTPTLYALRVNGRGDVTESSQAGSVRRAVPHNPSPLAVGEELYLLSDNGVLTCLDVATLKQLWQQRLAGSFSASPIYVAGRVYVASEDGTVSVLAAGRERRLLAENSLPGRMLASPAVADETLYLRTDVALWAIRTPDSRAARNARSERVE